MSMALALAENGFLPDWVTRIGIRRLLADRLRSERRLRAEAGDLDWVATLDAGPVAVLTEKANQQHYELPPEFFKAILGPRLKYSSCLWEERTQSLEEAEESMLSLTAQRAGIEDGMRVLDLGCGWGSFSLWLAERYPNCRVTAVSNSVPQGAFIRQTCGGRNLKNVSVLTADINRFEAPGPFDRIVSIEMFEHVRNYARIFEWISRWLDDEGKLFLHIFCHRDLSYPFEDRSNADWMARYFFSGGVMPSETLFDSFQDHLQVRERWRVNGIHYSRTLEAWLGRLDEQRQTALAILRSHYGEREAPLWFERWRLFLMACSELFRYRGGEEWFVSHSLLSKI